MYKQLKNACYCDASGFTAAAATVKICNCDIDIDICCVGLHWIPSACLVRMETIYVTKVVLCVINLVVWQAFSSNKRLRGINYFRSLGFDRRVWTYRWIWKVSVSLVFFVSFCTMGTSIWSSRDKILSYGGAARKFKGVPADEWGCREGGSRFMQVEFGDQRFPNSHCLSFLHFLIHVRVVVMKAGGKCELILEQKV